MSESCRPPRHSRSAPRRGSGAPKGASNQMPRDTIRRCRLVVVFARLRALRGALAFRRSAAALAGALTSRLSSRPCFLGRGQCAIRTKPARGLDPRVDTGFPARITHSSTRLRALPAPSCPSPVTAPHASAVIPRGLMPKAAPAQVALQARTEAPHSLRFRKCPREGVPW
jgi:hypothetical protein